MKWLFRLGILLIVSNLNIYSVEYRFERKSPNAGFAFNQLNTIVTDQDGTIWFGSTNGVYKYNSRDIERFTSSQEDSHGLPSNNINHLYLDDFKQLWVCTEKGLCKFNRKKNKFELIEFQLSNDKFESNYSIESVLQANDSTYLILINSVVNKFSIKTQHLTNLDNKFEHSRFRCNTMVKNKDGKIWLGGILGMINTVDGSLQHFEYFGKYTNSLISTLCFDEGNIWIGYVKGGVDKVTKRGEFIRHYDKKQQAPYQILSNRVRKIIRRENGDIWIATFLGINIISKNEMYSIQTDQFNNLPDNSVYELTIDHQGGIWIGTWSGGLAYYSDYNYYFKHIIKIPFNSIVSKNNISSFAEDKNGLIWIGCETEGIKTFNPVSNDVESYKLHNAQGDLINVKSLAFDSNERLWIGTFNNGIWYMDKEVREFQQYNHEVLKGLNIIHKILITDDGYWYCSHGQGAVSHNPETSELKQYKFEPGNKNGLQSNLVWTVLEDSEHNIWLGTDKGVSVKKNGSDSFQVLSPDNTAYHDIVYTLCEVRKGELWAGTKEKGILKINTSDLSIQDLDIKWNKSFPEVYNLILDNSQNVWITSDQGIQMYNQKTNTIHLFDEKDGVLGNNFNPNAALKSSRSEILFGGSYGFNVVQPDAIVQNPYAPEVFLSSLKINNTPFEDAQIDTCNSKFLPDLSWLSLNHSQNSLSFSFITNNYIKSSNNQYKYRMVNYQDEWTGLGNKTEVDFTKMPPGEYQLEVLASNNDGLWSEHPYRLDIKIIPPFWGTHLAYVLYFLFLSLIVYLLIKESFYRVGMQKKLLVERFRHESEEKLFKEKQKFFTNISHEFRTPLTLILSPINILFDHFKYEDYAAEHLNIIKRNADRLLRLTNEILDFRLIETDKIKLKKEPTDIIALCKSTYDCFAYAAVEKEINFIFSSKYESLKLDFDPVKIEKIIYNLLSNAFKFSADKSQIILSIDTISMEEEDYLDQYCTGVQFTGECLEIRVKDFGKGISADDIPTIFDRFSSKNDVFSAGTGLGLHISQEYIKLHGGNIIVSSIPSRETTFIVNIPLIEPSDIKKQNVLIQPAFDDIKASNKRVISDTRSEQQASEEVILLIEDHLDLRKYLKNLLSRKYKVLTASNGVQGYEIALEIVPNLIISDVMMPGMDGITLTKKIKQHQKTNHISIILLTALTDTSSEIDGISKGADSYLTKPVDEKLLFAHIQRLLDERKKINEQLILNQDKKNDSKVIPFDQYSFLEKIEVLVMDNLQNPQFDVEELAEKLNISRSSLHRKLKKEVNKSVTEFIREVRIKKAIDLMKTKKYNLDEICFYIGFNSHSYFTRSFKKVYGQTPKDFYDKLKAEM